MLLEQGFDKHDFFTFGARGRHGEIQTFLAIVFNLSMYHGIKENVSILFISLKLIKVLLRQVANREEVLYFLFVFDGFNCFSKNLPNCLALEKHFHFLLYLLLLLLEKIIKLVHHFVKGINSCPFFEIKGVHVLLFHKSKTHAFFFLLHFIQFLIPCIQDIIFD